MLLHCSVASRKCDRRCRQPTGQRSCLGIEEGTRSESMIGVPFLDFVDRAKKRLAVPEEAVIKAFREKCAKEAEFEEGVARLQHLRGEVTAQLSIPHLDPLEDEDSRLRAPVLSCTPHGSTNINIESDSQAEVASVGALLSDLILKWSSRSQSLHWHLEPGGFCQFGQCGVQG